MKLAERMRRSIANRPGTVILRSELAEMASPTQLSRILSRFVNEGRLIRVSKGVYVKTRTNRFTGSPSPAGTLESIAAEVFDKLKVPVCPGRLFQDYNAGSTTQVPVRTVVNTGKRRISRRIEVGGRVLAYENDFKRTSRSH